MALRAELQRRATVEAADFVEAEMPNALRGSVGSSRLRVITREPGPILEFGVYTATTTNFITRQCSETTIFGFDSFKGLPEHWARNRFSRRNYNRGGRLPKVASNVQLIVGLFQDTLPDFLKRVPGPFAVLHLDCDIYSSANYVLTELADRLAPGSVLIFDEFFNYRGYQLHEFKAFHEFLARRKLKPDYLAFSGQQVSVKLNSAKR